MGSIRRAFRRLRRRMAIHSAASATTRESARHARHVLVQDRGSDVSVFCFAGMAVRYAGLPTFEFRNVLRAGGHEFNLVFFRDVQRMGYHVAPGGTPDGLPFYEAEVRDIMEKLGATHNVAIGASSGGAAAFYFATRCGMNQVIAFNPTLQLNAFLSPRVLADAYLNLARLVHDPGAYFEIAFLPIVSLVGKQVFYKKVPHRTTWDIRDVYERAGEGRPAGTIFYGAGCLADARQAKLLAGFSEVTCVPVNSRRHNCAADLMKRGELSHTITAEIEEALDTRREPVLSRHEA